MACRHRGGAGDDGAARWLLRATLPAFLWLQTEEWVSALVFLPLGVAGLTAIARHPRGGAKPTAAGLVGGALLGIDTMASDEAPPDEAARRRLSYAPADGCGGSCGVGNAPPSISSIR